MSDSPRTPIGMWRCPVCGGPTAELADPAGLALCPSCGELLGWVRDYLYRTTALDPELVTLHTRLDDLGLDSLDRVEVIMELEEHFGRSFPEWGPEDIETIGDWLRRLQTGGAEPADER